MTQPNDTKKKKRTNWYVLGGCAIWGAVIGYVGTDLVTGGANGQPIIDLDASSIIAVALGLLLAICLAIVTVGYTFPKLGIEMKMFEDKEQWEDERTMMALSCVGGGAYAVALILLALAEPLGMIGSVPLLAGLGALAVVFTYASVRLLREYDELWQGVNSETSVLAFYLTLIIGGAWSTLAHLEFVAPLAPLDWISLMTAACIVGAIISTQKRGMLED